MTAARRESRGSPAAGEAAAPGLPQRRTAPPAAARPTRHADRGAAGYYDGPLDSRGQRHGRGTMTYDGGDAYEGGFLDDTFHGQGLHRFRDGRAEYAMYEHGSAKGEGVAWSADRQSAYKTVDGEKRGELSLAEAEQLARERFGSSVPPPAVNIFPAEAEAPAPVKGGQATGLLGRLFASRKVDADGTLHFKDHGEWGSYEGDVDAAGDRRGRGKMTYKCGHSYEGGFVGNKFECDKGVYRWADGDEHEGGWKGGQSQGQGCFKKADGTVEYSTYEDGESKGDGVWWSPDRATAHKLLDGKKQSEVSATMAASLAKELFGREAPGPCAAAAAPAPAPAAPSGFFGSLFSNRKTGPDGRLLYRDHGLWGSYEGDADAAGDRRGRGKMTFLNGDTYEGSFVADQFECDKGAYRWADGDEWEGGWKGGQHQGQGCFKKADGTVEYSTYEDGAPKGGGVQLSPDRKTAHALLNGEVQLEMLLEEARSTIRDAYGLPVPPPFVAPAPPAPAPVPPASGTAAPAAAAPSHSEPVPASNKGTGFFGSLFASRKAGPDGTTLYKDHGLWGSYDGEVDEVGDRRGRGKMTYTCGDEYEGGFVDEKFECDRGVYRFAIGEEYDGGWKAGEQHGKVRCKKADGTVEYAMFENGEPKGDAVWWSADRKTAHRAQDGKKRGEISTTMAEALAKELFDWAAPELEPPKPPKVAPAPDKGTGFFGSFFANRKVGPDGTLLFKDNGDWGSYEGDVDASGNRTGQGKMTYNRGDSYEGGFVDNKFECEKGVYRFASGEEYEGGWKAGDQHGKLSIQDADGSVKYSMYENGEPKGEGLLWSPDRKTSHRLLDGTIKTEVSLTMAADQARKKFDRAVPEPYVAAAPVTGFFGSLFANQKIGPNGKILYWDDGDWGSYEGDVDEAGNRQGKGKMTYKSGDYYEGGFVDNKYECDQGVYRWVDGTEHAGSFKAGKLGKGRFKNVDGSLQYSEFEEGEPKGEGVMLGADLKTAHALLDGKMKLEILVEEAESIIRDKFEMPFPEPSTALSSQFKPAPASVKETGLIGGLFGNRKVGPNGKMLYHDVGEWGSFEGDVDASGNRIGQGKMTYKSGNYFEGNFVDDKFHGDKGVYRWVDGDEYDGAWKQGEQHGKGSFKNADGTVEYLTYEKGEPEGAGLIWSMDRKTAHKMLDGMKESEISLILAANLAQELFGMLVPEPSKLMPPQSSKVGFIGRLFSNRKFGPDGKMLFSDKDEWGSYEGNVDGAGRRQGKGKMTYNSGGYYEGGFVDDKYDCDKGIYHLVDGEEYEGSFKAGFTHGKGSLKNADGTVSYSGYKNGETKGDGVWWSADRKTAHSLLDGVKTIEMSVQEAEALAKEMFDLPTPEVSAAAAAAPAGFFGRLFQSGEEGIVGPDGKMRYTDHGQVGSYEGGFDTTGKLRLGEGEMGYDCGDYYKGSFVDNKFHGTGLMVKNNDGEYEGAWSKGERHGNGILRVVNGGIIIYSTWEKDIQVGEGLEWSADCKRAHKTVDGVKKNEISLFMAKKLAQEKYALPVPEPCASRRFEDRGDKGSYDGELVKGLRQGEGKMLYDSGNSYKGNFSNNQFGNEGLYRWSDGTEYQGSWKEGSFNGIGIYRVPNGGVDYSMYTDGCAAGVGIFWSAGYTKAYHTLDGVKMDQTSLADAEKLAEDKFSLSPPSLKPQLGITSRIFLQKSVGPNGRLLHKDHGEWGSFIGELNASGERHGQGTMIYESGSVYEGAFANDKYNGDKGVFTFANGDEHEGEFKDGEPHGKGIFRMADGIVEYTMYEAGEKVGDGVMWNADRKTAQKMVDGETKSEISLSMAQELAKEKFDLPVPEPSTVAPSPSVKVPASIKKPGFFASLFANRKMGPDGKMLWKDYGEWGSFDGDVDEAGNRQGKGKMTYKSGSYYEGGFVDDKFECEKGVYHWVEGDEHEGAWKEGKQHGTGRIKNADGTVEYSNFEEGEPKGDGVKLSADRKIAHTLLDGKAKLEILVEEAESIIKEKLSLHDQELGSSK